MPTALAVAADDARLDRGDGRRRTLVRKRAGTVLAAVILAVAVAGCMPADARTFLDRTNSLRSSHRVPAIQEHGTLTDKAEAWAQHMASTGVLAHSNLTAGLGGLPWRSLGENVGYSVPSGDKLLAVHNMFVNSSAHRGNLLNGRFTHMGVGVAQDRWGRIWVAEVFATL